MGTPGCVNRRKESLQLIQEQVCIWSARETVTLLSWRPWGHRGARRRWWRPTARCKRRSDNICQAIGLNLSKLCFLKKLPRCFHWRSSARSWVFQQLDQRSKTTSRQKWQENRLQCIKLCVIRSPWFIYEFLDNAHTYFFIIFITGFCIWRQQIHRKSSTRKKRKYEWGATVNSLHMNQQKPKTQINMNDAKKYKAICCMTCRTGCRSSEKIWSVKVVLQSHGEALRLRIETLAVLSTRTFRRTLIAKSAWRQKITRASRRRRAGTVVPRAEHFGDLITADRKVLSEESESRNNHRYAVVVQDLAILPM